MKRGGGTKSLKLSTEAGVGTNWKKEKSKESANERDRRAGKPFFAII